MLPYYELAHLNGRGFEHEMVLYQLEESQGLSALIQNLCQRQNLMGFLPMLGIEPRASPVISMHSTTELLPQPGVS